MDDERFDRIARSLAEGASRRRVVRGLAAGAFAVGAAALARGRASAQAILDGIDGEAVGPEDVDPTCKNERAINNRTCPFNQCVKRFCVCAENVNGSNKCVNLRRERCPTRDECDRVRNCREGETCIKTGGCCPGQFNACVPRCG